MSPFSVIMETEQSIELSRMKVISARIREKGWWWTKKNEKGCLVAGAIESAAAVAVTTSAPMQLSFPSFRVFRRAVSIVARR